MPAAVALSPSLRRAAMTGRPTVKKARKRPSGVQLGEATARSMILQGAAAVFAEHGVRVASVEDILEAANVSRRTFYRFYQSKEDVLVAMYWMGTEGLYQACKLAVREESDLSRRLERCIDAHLLNARGLGRLVYVLGGEAQRTESALHARRKELHELLVELLSESATSAAARPVRRVDSWLLRALILSLEGLTRLALEQGDEGRSVSEASLKRVKRVLMNMAKAALLESEP